MVGLISLLCLPTAGAVFLGREDSPCHLQSHCVQIRDEKPCTPVTVGKAQQNLALYTYLEASAKINFPLPTCDASEELVAQCSARGHDVNPPCKTKNEELWWPEALEGFFSQIPAIHAIPAIPAIPANDEIKYVPQSLTIPAVPASPAIPAMPITITTSDKREYAGVTRVVRLGRGARGIPSYGGIESARDDLFLRIGDAWVPYVDSCRGSMFPYVEGPWWKCERKYVRELMRDNTESLHALQRVSPDAMYSHMFLDSNLDVHMWSDHMKVNGRCTRRKYVKTMPPNGRIEDKEGWQEGAKEDEPCAWAQVHWTAPHYWELPHYFK